MKMAEMQRNYYVGADAEIASVMNTQYEDEDGSSDDADNEFSPFEKKIFKMIPLTPDGGVKKRIISTGLETDGAVPVCLFFHSSLQKRSYLKSHFRTGLP